MIKGHIATFGALAQSSTHHVHFVSSRVCQIGLLAEERGGSVVDC